MKTLTEFSGVALSASQRAIVPADATPEQLAEAWHVDPQKVPFLTHALELYATRPHGVKRIVVLQTMASEKPPEGAVQRGEHFYMTEFFPHAAATIAPKKDERPQQKKRRPPRKTPPPPAAIVHKAGFRITPKIAVQAVSPLPTGPDQNAQNSAESHPAPGDQDK